MRHAALNASACLVVIRANGSKGGNYVIAFVLHGATWCFTCYPAIPSGTCRQFLASSGPTSQFYVCFSPGIGSRVQGRLRYDHVRLDLDV